MPIASILSQPTADKLTAAYRPILLRARATATGGGTTPPVVYCDIYFNGIFYKTLSKTLYTVLNVANTDWEFDIQDAAQEYLTKHLGAYGSTLMELAPEVMTTAFVRFRSSGLDAGGFILPEGTAPIQGTSSSAPVAGTGTESNHFFIVNATLQHDDNQDLEAHLNSFKSGTWDALAFPLTHRPDGTRVTPQDSDFYPIIYKGTDSPVDFIFNYRYRNQDTWRVEPPMALASLTGKAVYYIPDGPANLASLFPSLNFNDIAEIFLIIRDSTTATIATTSKMLIDACEDDSVRIHFLNRLGAIDAIDFKLVEITKDTKADTSERPLTTPLVKNKHAISRFNVRSNESYQATTVDFQEEQLDYLDEIFESPLHWIGWNGGQGQAADYLPVVFIDQKVDKRKTEDRYQYEIAVEFALSHEKFIIRN